MSAKSQGMKLQLFYSPLYLLETSNWLNKQAMAVFRPRDYIYHVIVVSDGLCCPGNGVAINFTTRYLKGRTGTITEGEKICSLLAELPSTSIFQRGWREGGGEHLVINLGQLSKCSWHP